MVDCIILAGGLGTRIKNVLGDTIKPMALVNDKPFISIIIDSLKNYGIENFIICAGYGSNQIVDYFNHQNNKINITYSFEEENSLLGTGGAIKKAIPSIKSEKFLVVNGDSLCFENYDDFIKQSFSKNCYASILGVYVENSSRYGTLSINSENYLIAFQEKTNLDIPGLINAGIYFFDKEILNDFPAKEVFSIEKDFLSKIIVKKIFIYKSKAPFIDIGIPEDYYRTESFIKKFYEEK